MEKLRSKISLGMLIIIIFSNCSCSSSASVSSSDYDHYKIAMNYISSDSMAIKFLSKFISNETNDKELDLIISPKILSPQLVEFGQYAIKNRINFYLQGKYFRYKSAIIDSLLEFENEIRYPPFINYDLKKVLPDTSGQAIIFFSKNFNNFLTANLFYRKKEDSILDVPSFGLSLLYLFIFKDSEINIVMKEEVSNN